MSVTRLKELLSRLNVPDRSDLDAVRVAYINHLRATSAGRGGEDHQTRLAIARARESELKGDKIEMDMARDAGLLVPAAEVEQHWTAMIAAARAELISMSAKLRAELSRLFDVEVPTDMIDPYINAALEHLAISDDPDLDPDIDAGEGPLASAAEHLDD